MGTLHMQFNVNLLDTESKNNLIEKIKLEKEYRLRMIKEGRTNELISNIERPSKNNSDFRAEGSIARCSDD